MSESFVGGLLRAGMTIAAAAWFLMPAPVLSQAENTSAALTTIEKAADDICGAVKQEGSSAERDVTGTIGGTVNLNIGGILRDLIGKLIEGNASISGAWKSEQYQGVLREHLASVVIKNSNCRLDVLKILSSSLMYTAIVNNNNSCPPGPNITIDRSVFLNNKTAVSIAPGISLCIVDTTMKDNGSGLEVR